MSFAEELNAHIGNEYAASQQYVAIAVYYDQETLPQLAAHFYRQAVEERNHAHMIVQYLLDADLPVTVPAVVEPKTTFTDAVAPVTGRILGDGKVNLSDQMTLRPRQSNRLTCTDC